MRDDLPAQEESAAELLLATEELLRKLNSNKAAPLPPDGYLSDEDTGLLRASARPCMDLLRRRCRLPDCEQSQALPDSSGAKPCCFR